MPSLSGAPHPEASDGSADRCPLGGEHLAALAPLTSESQTWTFILESPALDRANLGQLRHTHISFFITGSCNRCRRSSGGARGAGFLPAVASLASKRRCRRRFVWSRSLLGIGCCRSGLRSSTSCWVLPIQLAICLTFSRHFSWQLIAAGDIACLARPLLAATSAQSLPFLPNLEKLSSTVWWALTYVKVRSSLTPP